MRIQPVRLRLSPAWALALASAAGCLLPLPGIAQTAPLATASIPASPSSAAPAPAKRPTTGSGRVLSSAWKRLTPPQQAALQPLATHWDSLSEGQRQKWLEISKNYPRIGPAEQAKLHGRMTEWVSLTPQQRASARLNFGQTLQLPADEKKAKWQAYQSLSKEDRQKLAATAPAKPTGAAPAVKPVPPKKLAIAPGRPASAALGGSAAGTPRIALTPHAVDSNTLLPQSTRQHP